MNVLTPPRVTAVTTKITLRAGMEPPFAAWQSAFTRVASDAPGFLSLEIIPAFAGSPDWQIVQRFRSPDRLALWQASASRAKLFAELAPMRVSGEAEPADEAAPDFHSLSCVTEVITTVVGPGQEPAFRAWAESIQTR